MTPIGLLAAKLPGPWDAIVGIPRGGLILAAALGYELDVPAVSSFTIKYDRNRNPLVVLCQPTVFACRVLLVEDGVRTGTLIEYARSRMERHHATVTTAALWVSKHHAYRPDVWLEEVDDLPSGRSLLGGGL